MNVCLEAVCCVYIVDRECVRLSVCVRDPPIQRYAAQVQDGGSGQQHVQRGADQAEGLAIDPVVMDQLNGSKRHNQH